MNEYNMALAEKALVLAVNLMVLACLFVAMYRASLFPDDFTPVFMKTFFTALAPTLVCGWAGKRYLSRKVKAVDAA